APTRGAPDTVRCRGRLSSWGVAEGVRRAGRSALDGDLGSRRGGGVAGVDHPGAAQRQGAVVGGDVAGADRLQELGDGARVTAVLAHLRAELGGDALDLGPHGDAVVAGPAGPFNRRPAVGAVEGDVA